MRHINDYNYRDTLTYIQYLNGVYTKIVFPGLDSLKKVFASGHVSINKARIIIPVTYDGGWLYSNFSALQTASQV